MGVYALLALIVIPVFPHFVSPNELSRWLLDKSIVERGTIEVTAAAAELGPRFEDLAQIGDRFYSNKAPGTVLLTLPAYAAARLFTDSLRATLTFQRLAGATLPVIVLAWMFVRLGRRLEISDQRISTVVWLLLFATPLFAYGLLLFSHALIAAALFGAWLALDERRPFVAGALLGLAVAAEYPAAIPAALLVSSLVVTRRWGSLARVIVSATPFAIALAGYHYHVTGSPIVPPYSFSRLAAYQQLHDSGIHGIGLPSLSIAAKLLLNPTYGLLIFAPVLALAVPAFVAARKAMSPSSWWTLLLVPLSLLILYSGYPYWHGGWNVGPRYLVPAIPFLIAPMLLNRGTRVEFVLAGFSTLAVTLTTLIFPFVPEGFAFPWTTLAAPLLGSGLVAPNLFHLLAPPLAIAVPFLLCAGIAILALPPRYLPYLLIGALIAIGVGTHAERVPSPTLVLQRNYIAAVYFEQDHLMPTDAPLGLLRRREIEWQLPPSSWPF
jgi:hypothetical protein